MREIIKNVLHNRDIEFRERLFRILCLEGILVGVVALIGGIIFGAPVRQDMYVLAVVISLVAALILCIRFKMTDIAIMGVAVVLVLIVFPLIYFSTGGIVGGAITWLVLGVVFVFMMFREEQLMFFGTFTVIVDTLCIYYSYVRPEVANTDNISAMSYITAGFALVIVGLTCGGMFMYQSYEYDRERELNVRQHQRLEQMARTKDRFYANFSHEIRNPINAIVGLNEIILRDAEDPVTISNSQAIKSSSKLLLNLINDIMDISQIQNKSMKLTEVPYSSNELFTEIIELVRTRARDKGLTLRVEIDPGIPAVLIGDQRRLVQIILNLLTNAIKYTPEGEVVLSASSEPADSSHVRLRVSVSDTGLGIKRENIKYLFDSYSQFDRVANNKIEGNGLGLSIAKELLTLMGGTISVDSVYTKGSTFTINVAQGYEGIEVIGETDILSGNVIKDDSSYERSFEASDARVLVVDDDELNRAIFVRLLKDTKVKIDEAPSGKRALQMTAQKYYHAIFVDYMMPEMDGVELLASIRKQDGGLCKESAIVALTGATIPDEKMARIDGNFDMKLNKPIDGNRLERVLLDCIPEELVEYRQDSTILVDNAIKSTYVADARRRIKITTDCACDLTGEIAADNDISMMYLYIKTGRGRFMDTVEVDANNLSAYGEETKDMHPESASVDDYERFFGSQLDDNQEIIHLSLSSRIGENYDNACKAAESFDHVTVIDSGQISGGLGLLAITAAGWARNGKSTEDIVNGIMGLKDYVVTDYVLPTPDLFRKESLLSPVHSRIVTSMRLHPVVRSYRNRIRVTGVMVGNLAGNIHRHFRRNFRFSGNIDTQSKVIINHAGLSVRQQDYAVSELKHYVDEDRILVHKTSVTIGISVGIGAVGVTYFRKNRWL